MKIQLDLKASIIKDILDSLFIIENKEIYDKELLKILPYAPDKNIEKYLQELSKSKKIDKEKLSFYFHSFYFNDDIFSISNCMDVYNSEEMSFCTVEDYLSKLQSRSEEEILQKITLFLADHNKKGKLDEVKEYEDIHRDKNKILELLKKCNICSEAKWNIYMLINEPKNYMKEFCEFIEDFLPVFNKAFILLTSLRESFNRYVSDRFKNEDIEYLKSLPSFENIDKFNRVIVSTMTVNYASLLIQDMEDTAYVYIGMNIEKVLEVINGKSHEEVLLSLLRTISDSSRFNILKALQNEELFGIELAEKLGLTNATISHHINFLLVANLIIYDKRDGKNYYKLNKEPLRNIVKSITKEFNL